MKQPSHKIRLIDVAKESGCSLGAVGKVLNGGNNSIRVGENAQKRIREAAEKLGYERNFVASMLAGGKSNLIGVLIDTQAGYRNKRLLAELECAASKRNLRLIVGAAHDSFSTLNETCVTMRKYGVEGLIVVAHDYPEFRKEVMKIEENLFDAVFLEKPYLDGLRYVATSRRTAMKSLVADAVRRNKKRIGIVHGKLDFISEQTLVEEYRSALAENGLEFESALIMKRPNLTEQTRKNAQAVMEHLILSAKPDLFFCDDAEHGIAIQSLLQSQGVRIPGEIEIVGGNNDPFFDLVTPEIQSFDPNYDKIAEALLDALREWSGTAPVIHANYPDQRRKEK